VNTDAFRKQGPELVSKAASSQNAGSKQEAAPKQPAATAGVTR
jgi:hypothetical protein